MSAPRIFLAFLPLSAKNYQNWWKFDKILTKTILHSVFRHGIVDKCLLCVQNVDVLKDPDVVKQLGNILKTNVRACKSLGHPYMLQVHLKSSLSDTFFIQSFKHYVPGDIDGCQSISWQLAQHFQTEPL